MKNSPPDPKKTSSKPPARRPFSTKDFRESPFVEQFYKNIYDYKLREKAYKTAIEVYLKRNK